MPGTSAASVARELGAHALKLRNWIKVVCPPIDRQKNFYDTSLLL
ncbi:MAG: hypothetical protein H6677_04505 [Candidatus Obscuribacterales bacterium]|nr:hypothetical protein [Cyanobacteria bacterium HKST-UBA01]MCB9467518.1 hypothetical protein [Candidatus Obscuribacterales bacterium]